MFEDPNGKVSSMRVFSFLSLLFSFAVSFYCIATGVLDGDALIVIGMYVTGAFAPKVTQKFAEMKVGNSK